MEMCGCDNQDNDYSSSNDDDDDQDDDADSHADGRMFAFDVADDQGIQFVAAAADEEDYYDAPDNIDGEAPAEAEFDAEAEALSLRCAEAEKEADAERRDSPIYNSDFRVPIDYDVIPGEWLHKDVDSSS
jgi:hypothetical protein